jgi:hypothetical protein
MNQSKNPFVVLLLLHGIAFNFFLLPLVVLFPTLNAALQLSTAPIVFQDWVNSVCINVFAWHLFYAGLKNPTFFKTPRRLRDELKKFSWILRLEHWVYQHSKSLLKKPQILIVLMGIAITFNIILPIIATTILGHKLSYRSLGLSFISFQFVNFVAFYFYNKFPYETLNKEDTIPSPWLLAIVFGKSTKKKMANQ